MNINKIIEFPVRYVELHQMIMDTQDRVILEVCQYDEFEKRDADAVGVWLTRIMNGKSDFEIIG